MYAILGLWCRTLILPRLSASWWIFHISILPYLYCNISSLQTKPCVCAQGWGGLKGVRHHLSGRLGRRTFGETRTVSLRPETQTQSRFSPSGTVKNTKLSGPHSLSQSPVTFDLLFKWLAESRLQQNRKFLYSCTLRPSWFSLSILWSSHCSALKQFDPWTRTKETADKVLIISLKR